MQPWESGSWSHVQAGVDVLLQLLECHGSVLACCALRSEEVQSLARRGRLGRHRSWKLSTGERCNIERTLTEGAVELREVRWQRVQINGKERLLYAQASDPSFGSRQAWRIAVQKYDARMLKC